MRYIKKFESHQSRIAEKNKKHNYIQSIKKDLISKMDPNPIDVWYDIDDRLIELKDKFGTFVSKYGSTRSVIDFDGIDINIDIKNNSSYYTLADISNHKWDNNKKVNLEEAKVDYSIYASSFDDEFLKYYEKYKYSKTDALKPFYTILIGFETEYVNMNKEKCDDFSNELGKEVSSALQKMPHTIKIKSISYFNGEKLADILKSPNAINTVKFNQWVDLPPSLSSLSNLKYPRLTVSFFAD